MDVAILILLLAAVVVFLLATFGAATKINLIAFGLALLAMAFLLGHAASLHWPP